MNSLIKKIRVKIILFAIAALLAGCGMQKASESKQPDAGEPDVTEKEGEYRRISALEAQSMMSGEVIILDVRTQEEYDEGHIENAMLIPYELVGSNAEDVFADKDSTILIYCRSGRRSEIAARALIESGYTDVYDFGGILDWTGDVVKD